MTEPTLSAAPVKAKRARADLRALRPIFPYALRYKGRIAGSIVALTAASAATLVVPLAIRRIVDFGFTPDKAGVINSYFLAMLAVVAVLATASAARYFLVMTLGERIVSDVRSDVFRHLTGLDAVFYDRARVGELVSRLTADTTQLKSSFGSSASVLLRNLFLFVGSLALMFATSAKLSAFVFVVLPVIVLPLVASGRAVRKRSRTPPPTRPRVSAPSARCRPTTRRAIPPPASPARWSTPIRRRATPPPRARSSPASSSCWCSRASSSCSGSVPTTCWPAG